MTLHKKSFAAFLFTVTIFIFIRLCNANLDDRNFWEGATAEHGRLRRQWLPPCSSSYKPTCACYNYTNYVDITCRISNASDYEAVRDAFSRSTIVIHNAVEFILQSVDPVPLPTGIYGTKRVPSTTFRCYNRSTVLANITAGVFDPNDNWTTYFGLFEFNLSTFSFDFLRSFSSLATLNIYGSSLRNDIALEMPLMPSITTVRINDCDGFRQWYKPSLTPNVNAIYLGWMKESNDNIIEQLFASVQEYYGQLSRLTLNVNSLTRVPSFITKLSNINYLDLWGNDLITLPKGALTISSAKLQFLILRSMQIQAIEPGAFQGDFSSTSIELIYNEMTNFPSDAFKDLLTSMVNKGGSVIFTSNPVNYDCALAWLLVENRHLLSYVEGQLKNGTYFNELNPSDLANCVTTY